MSACSVARPVVAPVATAVVGCALRSGGPAPDPFIVGDSGSGGAGNWPADANRGLGAPFTPLRAGTMLLAHMRTNSASAGGNRYRLYVYAADGAGAPIGGVARPGTLIAVSAPSAIVAAGAQDVQMAISGAMPATPVWIFTGSDGTGSGGGSEQDSGGTNAAQTIMLNGILSFASPPATCPAWPGSPGPYSNVPSAWVDCA